MADQKWVPDLGRIVARYLIKTNSSNLLCEIVLGFRDQSYSVSHIQQIAKLRDFVARSDFSGWSDGCDGQHDVARSGNMVARHYAGDAELMAFIKLWDSEAEPLGCWLANVRALKTLDPSEMNRLEQLAHHR